MSILGNAEKKTDSGSCWAAKNQILFQWVNAAGAESFTNHSWASSSKSSLVESLRHERRSVMEEGPTLRDPTHPQLLLWLHWKPGCTHSHFLSVFYRLQHLFQVFSLAGTYCSLFCGCRSPLSLLLARLNKPMSSNLFLQEVTILPDTSSLFPAFASGPWLFPSPPVL